MSIDKEALPQWLRNLFTRVYTGKNPADFADLDSRVRDYDNFLRGARDSASGGAEKVLQGHLNTKKEMEDTLATIAQRALLTSGLAGAGLGAGVTAAHMSDKEASFNQTQETTMSTLAPASPEQIQDFMKAASDQLSAMGVHPDHHQALIAKELGAHAFVMNKEAFGNFGELIPEDTGKKMDDAAKKLPATTPKTLAPAGGGGKKALIMKLLATLGIGGAAAGAGYKATKAMGAADDEKEAMDKKVPGAVCEPLEVDKGEGQAQADGDKDSAKGVVVKKTKIQVLKEAMAKVEADKVAAVTDTKVASVTEIMANVVQERLNKEAEAEAHTALYNAAKDHMVNTMNIPEKQATEILDKHYNAITAE